MSRETVFLPHFKKKKNLKATPHLLYSITMEQQEENHMLSPSQSGKEGSPWLRL